MDWHALKPKRIQTDAASVLIVEDDEELRRFLSRSLIALGFDVKGVADALAAMTVIVDAPHVAVLDVHLPGASGLWLAEQIRTVSPTTAVVLATGDRRIPGNQTLRPDVVAYLVKPFTLEDLNAAVDEGVRWSALRRAR